MQVKRKFFIVFAMLLSLLLVCTSCGAPVTDLMAGVKAAERPADPDVPAAEFTGSATGFTWTLLQQSIKNPGNIFISPASVYLALAMTLNGADTSTRTAMLETLAADQLTVDQLNAFCRDWMTLMIQKDKTLEFSIANSIWYREGFDADKDFLQKNADYFAAGAKVLDFNKPEAAATINNWVKEATRGTIEKIIEKINPAVVMYLINTIYFKSDWATKFEKQYTFENQFQAPTGKRAVQFMHRTGSMAYIDVDGQKGVLLPYADDQYAFFAVLPPEGQTPRELIEASSGQLLARLFESAQAKDVELFLPQFETSYEDSLVDELKAMGMGVAFDSGAADFSLMNPDRARDLFISDVKHKTFCKINENGTEAAAATVVEISKTSVPSGDLKLEFNQPFLYGIVDTLTGVPVFIGVMEDPTLKP